MPELFLPDSHLQPGTVKIEGEKARYLAVVLRRGPGDLIVLKDNRGNAYSARIVRVTKKEIEAEILGRQETAEDASIRITLLQGILKGEKMDLVVQKATELGAAEIVPVVTERSQVRETRKVERWKKIAEEASRQSGRSTIPLVREAAGLDKLPDIPPGIFFWEKDETDVRDVLANFRESEGISVFIGPEGGFSETEAAEIKGRGFTAASLGRNILRAETAAIAVLSIVQYELGGLGRKRLK